MWEMITADGHLQSGFALVLLLILIISGKVFRDNWKLQGDNWKVRCWIAGVLALVSFIMLAFIPLAQA